MQFTESKETEFLNERDDILLVLGGSNYFCAGGQSCMLQNLEPFVATLLKLLLYVCQYFKRLEKGFEQLQNRHSP